MTVVQTGVVDDIHAEVTRSVAIVGSGPAGCYLAQALRKRVKDLEVTVLDRLPVPYGLLRYGVAPDHQGTKAVSRQFDRLFTKEGVRFAGNLEVGRDISLASLRDAFDAVVLSTGLHADRSLGVPGEELGGVIGSGRLTRILNGHPGESPDGFRAGSRMVVIGAGNVAIDVARLLSKTTDGFDGSDIDDDVLRSIADGVDRIEVVSRSPLERAKFDVAMLRELGQDADVAIEVHQAPGSPTAAAGELDEEALPRRALALELDARPVAAPRVTIAFHFGYRPVRFLGDARVQGVLLRPTHGADAEVLLTADSVVTAIGYARDEHDPLEGSELLDAASVRDSGRLDDGVYVAGWLRTGPRGTIPVQRALARDLAETIADELERAVERPGRGGFDALPESVRRQAVDFEGWSLIDQHERSRAAPGRVRAKVRDLDHLLAIARTRAVDPPLETMLTRSPA